MSRVVLASGGWMVLPKQVLEANEQHKQALDQYTSRLQAELNAVDSLIADVEALPDEEIQGNPGDKWCLHAVGAFEPTSIIDLTTAIDPRSPFHEDAVRREFYLKATTPNPFSTSERRYLEKAVIKENKRLTAVRAQQSGQDAFEAVKHNNKAFLENTEGIDWASVARDVSASNSPLGGRTAQECKVRWLGVQHPKINTEQWLEDEERRLQDLVASTRELGLDWVRIAELLGTNRTAMDCIRKFVIIDRLTFQWSSALDQKLLDAIHKYGEGNWSLIAAEVSPKISANQCQIRYGRSLNSQIKRGKFSPEEDELLMKAIEAYGSDWLQVAQAVPGRTNAQCRNRSSLLTGDVVKASWNPEEDAKLRAAVKKHGHKWESVRIEMGCAKSRTQYATRYKVLAHLDAHTAGVGDTAASAPSAESGGHLADEAGVAPDSLGCGRTGAESGGPLADEAGVAPDSMLGCAHAGSGGHLADDTAVGLDSILDREHAGGDLGLHGDPTQSVRAKTSDIGPANTSKKKGSKGSRKRKAPDSRPDSETGGSVNQGDHSHGNPPKPVRAKTSEVDIGPANTSKGKGSKGSRKRKAPDSRPDTGGSVNPGEHPNTSTLIKRPKPRPRPRALNVDAVAKDISQIGPALEPEPPTATIADDSQRMLPATWTDFATSDLSDLTDIEDVPPPKKARGKTGVVKPVARRASARARKPRASSSGQPATLTTPTRTRSSGTNNIDTRGE